ncbi:hypothetical protein [Spirosoma pollinicola]|uniref:Glycosyltransferase RgtA/B/C/D-like domain-containing protein n=1 Tax=Spirosoma pollinicola TaxID=2057025 RepID=A0A2K8Z0S8_9BACT|nr:hypothetical protein [Spirosoma pollinicola]AUD03492.1 hypothetical protein CWM47_17645 [Spirosoma pollinicola]
MPTDKLFERQTTIFSFVLGLMLWLSLTASLFFKPSWLWLDEVLSFILLSDPSWAHMNDALVANIDANPPLYFNLVWLVANKVSLNPYFLRALSVAFFSIAVALFYRHTTRLVGSPIRNFVIFTLVIGLTYLNFLLLTQIRSYALYLLLSGIYFISIQPLIKNPATPRLLAMHWLTGSALILTHNFGFFYIAASLSFFALLYLWSRRQAYWWVALTHLLIFGTWFLLWYSNFKIQSLAGKPYSWIPDPTFLLSFQTIGELIPTLSSRLEASAFLSFLPVLRVGIVFALFIYIAIPHQKQGYQHVTNNGALSFYLFAGFVMFLTALTSLVVSLTYLSVFLSRYQWPSHLLLLYQLVYAYHYFAPTLATPPYMTRVVPLYVGLMMGFIFYQNRKLVNFPSGILNYLPTTKATYPIFFESADYFLPIWHHQVANARYLLHRKTALTKGNRKSSSTDYNILKSVREKYNVKSIVWSTEFTKQQYPHFYVVDEASRYQIEYFIATHRVKVVRIIPVPIAGHRILDCVYL